MNITQVKNDIQSRHFSPVYIFTGEETGVMDIYIQQMAKVQKRDIVSLDTFKDIFNVLKVSPIIEKSILYVCREDSEILTNEKIWGLLDNTAWVGKNVVILTFTNLDKRKTFYKRYKDSICEFEPLDDKVLMKYIKREIDLKDKGCQKLIDVCEHSYSRIMLEIDKMKAFQPYTEEGDAVDSYDTILETFLRNGVIYQPAQDSIFLWSDAVMGRNKAEAFKLTDVCIRSGEAVLTMLTVLYNNVKQTLQLKSCEDKNVSETTGLTGWQIQCAKKFVKNYSIEELMAAMKLIRQMEVGIKTGAIEENAVVPNVLINIL